mgnify:FL=1
MEEILTQIVEKISSYNIVNNLYPGILFVYVLKIVFGTNLLSNNWVENLIVFYFAGMVLSRIGSIIIEPIMKKIKIIKYTPYQDYVKASSIDPLVDTLSETNNTYRTLLSTFICAFVYKLGASINEVCLKNKITFLQENKDWILLTLLILLFVFSYVKQTSYVRKRVESVLKRKNIDN